MGKLVWGDAALILCFGLYLLWWIIAFNPVSPIRGLTSGWLLIPAAIAGFGGLALVIEDTLETKNTGLFSPIVAAVVGVGVYIALLVVTVRVFNRAVTTELILIVAFSVIMCLEASTAVAEGSLAIGTALVLAVVSIAAGLASLVCYLLFYKVGEAMGFVLGIVPLVLSEAVLAAFVARLL